MTTGNKIDSLRGRAATLLGIGGLLGLAIAALTLGGAAPAEAGALACRAEYLACKGEGRLEHLECRLGCGEDRACIDACGDSRRAARSACRDGRGDCEIDVHPVPVACAFGCGEQALSCVGASKDGFKSCKVECKRTLSSAKRAARSADDRALRSSLLDDAKISWADCQLECPGGQPEDFAACRNDLTQCLDGCGIDLPNPGPEPEPGDEVCEEDCSDDGGLCAEAVEQAVEACRNGCESAVSSLREQCGGLDDPRAALQCLWDFWTTDGAATQCLDTCRSAAEDGFLSCRDTRASCFGQCTPDDPGDDDPNDDDPSDSPCLEICADDARECAQGEVGGVLQCLGECAPDAEGELQACLALSGDERTACLSDLWASAGSCLETCAQGGSGTLGMCADDFRVCAEGCGFEPPVVEPPIDPMCGPECEDAVAICLDASDSGVNSCIEGCTAEAAACFSLGDPAAIFQCLAAQADSTFECLASCGGIGEGSHGACESAARACFESCAPAD